MSWEECNAWSTKCLEVSNTAAVYFPRLRESIQVSSVVMIKRCRETQAYPMSMMRHPRYVLIVVWCEWPGTWQEYQRTQWSSYDQERIISIEMELNADHQTQFCYQTLDPVGTSKLIGLASGNVRLGVDDTDKPVLVWSGGSSNGWEEDSISALSHSFSYAEHARACSIVSSCSITYTKKTQLVSNNVLLVIQRYFIPIPFRFHCSPTASTILQAIHSLCRSRYLAWYWSEVLW